MPPSTAGAMQTSISIEALTGHETLNGSAPVMPAASQRHAHAEHDARAAQPRHMAPFVEALGHVGAVEAAHGCAPGA